MKITIRGRVEEILKNIYVLSGKVLEEEVNFFKSIEGYEYLVERINKELKRRKSVSFYEAEFPDTPKNPALMYVIRCKSFYKIGYTTNIKQRIVDLELANPFELELICCAYFDDVVKTERYLHQMFSDKKIKGEWFRLTKEDVDFLKSYFKNTS